MNKYAAEKIAQEYYALGAQLALTKQANFSKGFYKAKNALLGTLGGGATAVLSPPTIKELLSKSSDTISNSFAKRNLLEDLGRLSNEYHNDFGKAFNTGFYNRLGRIYHTTDLEVARKALKELDAKRLEVGPLNTRDDLINELPEALAIGAGLGVGAGIYKGLGKLDKKLKLY